MKYLSGNKIKRSPMLAGFVVGMLSVYACRLLSDHDGSGSSVSIRSPDDDDDDGGGSSSGEVVDAASATHRRVDFSSPVVGRNATLLCLVFVDDYDAMLMQRNVWLDKCGERTVHVSRRQLDHVGGGRVLTGTYSPNPWQYYCRTLMYVHDRYNSGPAARYDWIFVAKDDLWLIYENLMRLISLTAGYIDSGRYYAGQYNSGGAMDVDAGVLFRADTLAALVRLLGDADACDRHKSGGQSKMLDFYLKKLNNITPISNEDSYGCTLFHSISLVEAFNVKNLRPKIPKKCMSRNAITFKLGNHAMFYKYVLYKIRLVNKQDLMDNAKNILPVPSPKDKDIWWIEAFYELNMDPKNMSQTDFFYYWSKKRQIIL